ncbi:MAG TPA: TerC family protein, partial [Nitrolancea sp.]
METPIWIWLLFNVVVIGLIVLDLGVFHRKVHTESIRESAIWTIVWTLVALVFNAGIYFYAGGEPALSFLSGYVIERALAVDNIFVFMMIFTAFSVPQVLQYRALFWGIIGAIVLRAILIATGTVIIERFEWVLYFFGAFLVVTGLRMLRNEEKEIDPGNHPVVRLLRRIVPVTHEYRGARFLIRSKGSLVVTPLFVVLAVIAVSDLVFALDSIPAIFAITQDPFIVYTSNILAVLGLQAMYSMLGGIIEKFHLLKYGLAAVLAFVGVKMLAAGFYHVPIGLSLGIIVTMLTISIIASRIFPEHVTGE